MARNGSGTYSLPSGQPVVTGTVIDSTVHNAFASDVATALTASIAKDGQTTASANLPMGGFKHTGVADGTARTQYASIGQIQDHVTTLIGSITGTDTITGSPTVALPAYLAGQAFRFLPAGNNTGAVTINISGLGAKAILKSSGGLNLAAGDLAINIPATIVYNGTSFYLQNPVVPAITPAGDGAVGAPSYSFALDLDTGFYRPAANDLALSLGGVLNADFHATRVLLRSAALYGADGLVGAPFYSFENDPDTGVYRVGANRVALVSGGTNVLDVLGGNVTTIRSGSLYLQDGAVGTPGITFDLDQDTGFYRPGANQLNTVAGATLVTQHLLNGGAPQVGFADGVVATPSFSFFNDYDTGIYRKGTNRISIAAGGVDIIDVDRSGTNSVALNIPVMLADGAAVAGQLSLAFTADTDTGIYRQASGDIRVVCDGALIMAIRSNAAGQIVTKANIAGPDGAVGTPTYNFENDTDTGFYRVSPNLFRAAAGGADCTTWFLNGVVGQTLVQDGTAAIPGLGFTGDTDTGFYRVGANNFAMSAGGVVQVGIRSNTVDLYVGGVLTSQLLNGKSYMTDGTAAAPAHSFINASDTGFYRDTTNQIGIALGGTTGGQIAQGSFTGTLTGMTGATTGTVNYRIVGKMCTLFAQAGGITGTSNTNGMTMTGLPAVATPTPAVTQATCSKVSDNGAGVAAEVSITSASVMSFYVHKVSGAFVQPDLAGFTTSGTKGLIGGWSVTYPLS